jgi:CHAT domain-containing protein
LKRSYVRNPVNSAYLFFGSVAAKSLSQLIYIIEVHPMLNRSLATLLLSATLLPVFAFLLPTPPSVLSEVADPREANAKRHNYSVTRRFLLSQDIPITPTPSQDIPITPNSPDDIPIGPGASPNRQTKPPSLRIPNSVEPCSLNIPLSGTYVSPLEQKCQKAQLLLAEARGQIETSQFTAALQSLEQSLKLSQELGVRSYLIEKETLDLLGSTSIQLGDYARAVNYYQQFLTLIKVIRSREIKYQDGEEVSSDEVAALYVLATAYTHLGDYEQALRYAQQGVQIARGQNDNGSKWFALKTLGYVYAYFGDYSQAIASYEQSLELARASKDEFYKRERTRYILNDLGLLYLWRDDYSTSLDYFQRSFASFTEAEQGNKYVDFSEKAWILNKLGVVYEMLGDYPKAINYQQQSLEAYKKGEDKQRLYRGYKKVTYQALEVFVLNDLGSAFFKAAKLMEAELVLQEAIRGVESLRQGLPDSYKISFGDTQQSPYNTLQKILISQGKVEPALEVAERGRARAFVELLISKQATTSQPLSVKPVTIAEIKQIAQIQKATLVQYSLIYDEKQGERVYIWVVSPTGNITSRTVAIKLLMQQNARLAQLVNQSRETIGARGRSDIEVTLSPERLRQQQEQQTQKLKQLHQILIEPIADLLPKDPNQRVIFMPQGELFLVPFPALLDANSKPLIDRHTILTAPSIQVLELTRQQRDRLASRQSANNKSLIVGNPIMPKVVTRVGDTPVQLSNLPGAKQEALAIAKLFNTQAMTGAQATKNAIAQQMPNARIIHLATHGLLDDTKGLGVPGAIALAPSGNGQLNDGLLTSDEILDMKLNAELVVLSACDTGRGRITGDGVIGLSRSLITAGVPSIVVSLWKVPDEATALLMTEFYKNLKKSPDKAQALRQAMLTTKQQYPDPLNWAAFTLIGEAE